MQACDQNRKFGNSTISMTEVVITLILQGFDQKKPNFLRGALGSSPTT